MLLRFHQIPSLQVLYLFNRNALLSGFEVRLAGPGDASGISALVTGMPNSDEINAAFKSAQGGEIYFVSISSTFSQIVSYLLVSSACRSRKRCRCLLPRGGGRIGHGQLDCQPQGSTR